MGFPDRIVDRSFPTNSDSASDMFRVLHIARKPWQQKPYCQYYLQISVWKMEELADWVETKERELFP